MSEKNQFADLLPRGPLEPAQIAELARAASARVDVDKLVRRDRDHRFCLRLWRDEHSEAWLLGWLDDQEIRGVWTGPGYFEALAGCHGE